MGGPAADPEGGGLHPPLLLVHQGAAGLTRRGPPPLCPPRSAPAQTPTPTPGRRCSTHRGPHTTGRRNVDPASSLCHPPASAPSPHLCWTSRAQEPDLLAETPV